MLWIKALHVVFMVAWFAGLFYLPRLFVYHVETTDEPGLARFKVMEHKLFWYIMTPAAVLTSLFGMALLWGYAWTAYRTVGWLHAKLTLVLGLLVYHLYCGRLLTDFKAGRNRRSSRWFRLFNEIPTLFLVSIVVLVIVKPF